MNDVDLRLRCTGIRDQNDKLIFQNDIIENSFGTAIIYWHEFKMQFEALWVYLKKETFSPSIENCLIIGNKFQNPELLRFE